MTEADRSAIKDSSERAHVRFFARWVSFAERHTGLLVAGLFALTVLSAVVGLRALARELGVWLLSGSALVRREDGQAANRLLMRMVDRSRNLPPALRARILADVLDGRDSLRDDD